MRLHLGIYRGYDYWLDHEKGLWRFECPDFVTPNPSWYGSEEACLKGIDKHKKEASNG